MGHRERIQYGKVVHAFIKAGWNPPRPSDRATTRLIEDISDVHPQAKLELSQREEQVLRLTADGLTRSEIAKRLGISEEMVKDYATHVRRRLGARNAAHAVALGFRAGMLV